MRDLFLQYIVYVSCVFFSCVLTIKSGEDPRVEVTSHICTSSSYPARACAKGLRNRFCPSVSLSVCLSGEKF